MKIKIFIKCSENFSRSVGTAPLGCKNQFFNTTVLKSASILSCDVPLDASYKDASNGTHFVIA